jgi:hypothetical protein
VLRNQTPGFDQPSSRDDKLANWLNPTVNNLYAFFATLEEGVVRLREAQHDSFVARLSLQVFPLGKVVFAGIGVLLVCLGSSWGYF